ncbi:MAG: SDR family oxidoreductase [Candidatus Caenarcaniphilales bacterium]|nr:SDR family oxidoreductase [Candidatus Caenarcaniphilales bacterium]
METLEQTKLAKNKNRNLEGKLAIVTGAGRGLGRAMALDMASRGANIIATYSNSQSQAEELVKEINSLDQKAKAIQLNLSSMNNLESFKENLNEALKEFGREDFDILVNNAGISGSAVASNMTEEAFDELFTVNVKAVFFLIKELQDSIKAGGSIINLSSSLTKHSYNFTDYMVYSSTKAAINTLTRDFAVELGAKNIRVNAVAPGATFTDMTKDFLSDENVSEQFKSMTALKRIGQATDISPVVAFLASDDSKWVTGEIIESSGGALL